MYNNLRKRGLKQMYIAICDDDIQFCNILKDEIYTYSNMHNWESVVDVYYSGEEICKTDKKYDIIILDYQMHVLNGLDTAKALRKGANAFSCIIFLTSFSDIAISAYEVDTYRFVLKSTLFEGLFKALDDYRKSIKLSHSIRIKSEGDFLTIPTKDIVFFESQDKIVLLHLSNGSIVNTRNKLSVILKLLPSTEFVQISKSFVVNFKYIARESENTLTLKNITDKLFISRNYTKQFKQKYINYLRDKIQ